MVYDSGATDHMCPFPELFESITYYNQKSINCPKVMMGDENTLIPIKGYGYIKVRIHSKVIRVHALYVPQMGNTCLYLIKQHTRYQGCSFFAEAQHTSIAFPSFIIYPRVTEEIDVFMMKPSDDAVVAFDEQSQVEIPITNERSTMVDKSTSNINMIASTRIPYLEPHQYHQFQETVVFKKLVSHASTPKQATKRLIGFDVTSMDNILITPGEIEKVPTGLCMEMPSGMYCRIAPRSSLSLQHITVEGGVVDSDYRGQIFVMIKNNGSKTFHINMNTNIAQFIFERAASPLIRIKDNISKTARGERGFGSTDTSPTSNSRTKTFHLNSKQLLLMHKLPSGKTVFHRFQRLHCELPILHQPPEANIQTEDSPYIDTTQANANSKATSTTN
jgi:dUTP pyrophosphatase